MRIAVIKSKWNEDITSILANDCIQTLKNNKINVLEYEASGAVELPFIAKKVIENLSPNAVICIGCIIKGETDHYDFVAYSTAYGCQKVALDTGTAVIFGVLTTPNKELALARANGSHCFSGKEWAETAIATVKLELSLND